ncbi:MULTISPECIES: peptidylprolyl isomerase [Cyanophyceae]|uniref:peptidylprolyl isomerase n=1 Tax=Cyanophyceae TaxID=3028117 RepID=UPI0016893075|nr:peptidylprolyl isomerase [Trichocoleus sp. FACHB-40]MBD2004884.1 peptidylprolyl isomerase [Trichocoleus sp. FACHB-40]
MTIVLQVGDRSITANEIIPLLASYRLLPQLLRELIIDSAIASIECTPEEITRVSQQLQQHNSQGMAPEQAIRGLKIEKFKAATWSNKVEPYFLKRKGQLDKIIYSLIRTQDVGIAQELYFRIQEKEQSFAELAREYSQGPEAQTGGLIGPVELSVPHPTLAQILSKSQPGQLLPPTRLGEWLVIVRMEKFIPVQLDDATRQRLIDELFSTWLQEQVNNCYQSLAISH